MTGLPKTLQLFLMDGTPTGPIKCTLANWTGVTYLLPRTDLNKVKDRPHLKQTGIYLLFGKDDESDEPLVYVGQARERKNGKGVLGRVFEHVGEKNLDYWTHAIALITSNDSFGPTEISYLENAFHKMALDAGRYRTTNGNDPSPGNVTEEKQAELEEFISYAKLVIGALGYKVFEPLDDSSAPAVSSEFASSTSTEPLLRSRNSNTPGFGRQVSDGFVLLKESIIRPELAASCPKNTRRDRDTYADQIDENHKLTKDIIFTSPSRAASFITGNSVNGMDFWVNQEGLTLKEMEDTELNTAD